MQRIKLIIPLFIAVAIFILLWRGLSLHPNEVPSPLIGQPAPHFVLPNLLSNQLTTDADFLNQVTLVNVWATWCVSCVAEHAFLMQLAKDHDFVLYGLNYKDQPLKAKQWLREHGNPYKMIAVDQQGLVAIDWGVYGTPETFIIDQHGMVRYKIIGPLDQDHWQSEIKPLITKLRSES